MAARANVFQHYSFSPNFWFTVIFLAYLSPITPTMACVLYNLEICLRGSFVIRLFHIWDQRYNFMFRLYGWNHETLILLSTRLYEYIHTYIILIYLNYQRIMKNTFLMHLTFIDSLLPLSNQFICFYFTLELIVVTIVTRFYGQFIDEIRWEKCTIIRSRKKFTQKNFNYLY